MFLNRSARAFTAAGARKFKNLHAKSREFQPKNCAVSAPNARVTCERRAQNQQRCSSRSAAYASSFCAVLEGAGRVSRAKVAPKFIETFAISREKSKILVFNARQNAPADCANDVRLVHRSSNDGSLRCAPCACISGRELRRFSKFFTQNRANFKFFNRKTAQFRRRTRA